MTDGFWGTADKWHVAVSSTIALMLVAAMCYSAIAGIPMPEILQGAVWMVMGWFFGSQVQKITNNHSNAAKARAKG